ncbi:hypothetical protein [Naasia sp. SYSU D00948]|uniref:hypothetical protein n=1 Tax=Naasia sp. SYSU D00948 TaxID=2817379 RepID=UPI001B300A8E|nr:hypothetical protein [Naasia sp. SYSU D00948]
MRVVSYADQQLVTSDGVAEGVLSYSMALARSETSDVVRIPVLVDGRPTWAEIIIGPASQITTIELDDEDAHLDDEETVRELRQRREALQRRPAPVSPDPDPIEDDDPFQDLGLD